MEDETFRLWVWAGLPDRIHGEVLTPTGQTALVFDGGHGRISVAFVKDRVAYTGPSSPDVLEKLLGIRLTLGDLVGGLLEGRVSGDGYSIERDPSDGPGGAGLPPSVVVTAGERVLSLRRKRLLSATAPASDLGTGTPPPGMDVLPIEALEPLRLERDRGETGTQP
jgi:hypothetical protein